MNNQIQIFNIELPNKREDVSNRENINKLLTQIKSLENNIFSFETKELIKEAKAFKTNANKFIDEFKKFCDPLEEEGRTIAKTRSEVKLTLERIVDGKLQPIVEREKNLKSLKDKLFVPSSDINSCNSKLIELKQLDNYDWFALRDEALILIMQSTTFLENEILGFEKLAKEKAEAEEKIRAAREEEIRKNAIIETELRLKKEQEAKEAEARERIIKAAEMKERKEKEEKEEKERAIRAREFMSKPAIIPQPRIEAVNNIHEKKNIYNDMINAISQFDTKDKDSCKALIKEIADGKIPNLYIKYS